ncbi:hypothetical protein [Flammeovirga sp. OC4]|uniref:hypothetical protein n=1 Tax=Flammeovirga sp. OC4 TaxID=1382345 RepID=UPI0005C68A31|nr:hypothetical protein [Flammeovirga sp. OC4]
MLLIKRITLRYLLLSLIALFTSCKTKQLDHPFTYLHQIDRSDTLKLSEFESYIELYKKADSLVENQYIEKKSRFLILETTNTFIPVALDVIWCNNFAICDYSLRNIYGVETELIIDEQIIKQFILNNSKKMELSESPKKALIFLNYKLETELSSIESDLESLTEAYKVIWAHSADSIYNKALDNLVGNQIKDLVNDSVPYLVELFYRDTTVVDSIEVERIIEEEEELDKIINEEFPEF